MAALLPAELAVKADAFAPAPAGIKPEWYFVFMFQTLKYLPPQIMGFEGEMIGVVAFGVLGVVLLLIPFLDRRAGEGRASRIWTWLVYGALAYILVLTYLGYTADPAL